MWLQIKGLIVTFRTVQLSSKNSNAIKSYILAKLGIHDTLCVHMIYVHVEREGALHREGEWCERV